MVHDVAAGYGQHTALAQGSRLRAEHEMVIQRLVDVDRQLDHRNGGIRAGVHQHRTRTVVDAPTVEVGAHPRRMHDSGDIIGEVGRPRSGVLHVEQLAREPVEVIDGPRESHAVALMYQCALTTSAARHRATARPKLRHPAGTG